MFRVPETKIRYTREPENPRDYRDRQARTYSRLAGIYDFAVKWLPFWKTWITSVIPHISGERVLEVSTGTGYLLSRYAGDFRAFGLDYNRNMIEVTRSNLSRLGLNAPLIRADVSSLPYQSESFDCLVNTMSFTGYPNGRRAMAEFRRVLIPGGRLLLVDYEYPQDRNRIGVMLTRLMESAGDIIRDLSGLLQAYGFDHEECEIGGWGSVHLYIARKG